MPLLWTCCASIDVAVNIKGNQYRTDPKNMSPRHDSATFFTEMTQMSMYLIVFMKIVAPQITRSPRIPHRWHILPCSVLPKQKSSVAWKKLMHFIDGIKLGKNFLKYNYFTITDGINIYATIISTITDGIKLGHIYFHNISTIIFDLFFIPGIDCPLLWNKNFIHNYSYNNGRNKSINTPLLWKNKSLKIE